NLQRALIPVEISEDAARHSGEDRHGRIVRMNADPNACFLRYGGHLLDEIGVVFPDLLVCEYASARERSGENRTVPVPTRRGTFLIELARGCASHHRAAAGPDSVAHMGVGRVVDTGLSEIADVLLIFLDLRGASR